VGLFKGCRQGCLSGKLPVPYPTTPVSATLAAYEPSLSYSANQSGGSEVSYLTCVVFPVLPGQKDRVLNYKQELEANLTEFERLNAEGTFQRFAVYLQETPMGDFAIYAFEVDDPTKIRTSFRDSAYDTWYLDFIRDVHGLDLRTMNPPPSPPPQVYEWKSS
jgi:hypothetical protein